MSEWEVMKTHNKTDKEVEGRQSEYTVLYFKLKVQAHVGWVERIKTVTQTHTLNGV